MRRRVLLLITDLQIGGTPTVVRELAIRLRDPGRVEMSVACLAAWGPVADQLMAAGVSTTALGVRGVGDLPRAAARLVRLIRRGGIDTVFSFLLHANALAAAVARVCPRVRFLQSIQTTQPWPAWHWRVQRLIQPAAERIVVPSPSAARAARAWAGVPDRRLVIIPNAVDLASAGASAAPLEAPRPYPIGFIGRLDPVKRVPDLIHAVARLGGQVHLHLYGEGGERSRIEQAIARSGAGAWATLYGAIPAPGPALQRLGLLVLPSEAEGFGLVLIEAMAWGVPVIAANVPGVRDVVRDGETGLLVPPGDVPALADAIQTIVTDRLLRLRLIHRARQVVAEHYDWTTITPTYRRLLRIE